MPHLANKFQMQRQRKRFSTIEAGDQGSSVQGVTENNFDGRGNGAFNGKIMEGLSATHTPISSLRMKEKPFPTLVFENKKGSMGQIQTNN